MSERLTAMTWCQHSGCNKPRKFKVNGLWYCKEHAEQSKRRVNKAAYIPRESDEYRQKDRVQSRWQRLFNKVRHKLYTNNKLMNSTITMNYFQLVSVVLFTGVLFLITGYLLASQYYTWLHANTPP